MPAGIDPDLFAHVYELIGAGATMTILFPEDAGPLSRMVLGPEPITSYAIVDGWQFFTWLGTDREHGHQVVDAGPLGGGSVVVFTEAGYRHVIMAIRAADHWSRLARFREAVQRGDVPEFRGLYATAAATATWTN